MHTRIERGCVGNVIMPQMACPGPSTCMSLIPMLHSQYQRVAFVSSRHENTIKPLKLTDGCFTHPWIPPTFMRLCPSQAPPKLVSVVVIHVDGLIAVVPWKKSPNGNNLPIAVTLMAMPFAGFVGYVLSIIAKNLPRIDKVRWFLTWLTYFVSLTVLPDEAISYQCDASTIDADVVAAQRGQGHWKKVQAVGPRISLPPSSVSMAKSMYNDCPVSYMLIIFR